MQSEYDLKPGEVLEPDEWKRRRDLANADRIKRRLCSTCECRLAIAEVHGGALGLKCNVCGSEFVVAAWDVRICGHGTIYDPRGTAMAKVNQRVKLKGRAKA